MHIIHVATSLDIGGAQIMLRRFLGAPRQDGTSHAVVSLIPGGRIRSELEDAGFQVTDLGLCSLAHLPLALRRLRRIIRDQSPDVVHGWMYHGCLIAGLATRRDIPLVLGVHHSLQNVRAERLNTRMILRALAFMSGRSAAVAYCGHSIAKQHEEIGFAADRQVVIANGIDCEAFRPDPSARARILDLTGIPQDRVIIGNVTRNHPMKDVGLLVRALHRMLADGIDAQLVIMGEGHEDGPARSEARTLRIEDRVTILPARSDVAKIVPGFDVFALCSAWGEAFSLAMGEAMAAAVPCVSTDVGDSRWLLGDPGRIVPPRDDLAMARVLTTLAKRSSDKRRAVGQADRARILANFSLSTYCTAHADLYDRVAGRWHSPTPDVAIHSLASR